MGVSIPMITEYGGAVVMIEHESLGIQSYSQMMIRVSNHLLRIIIIGSITYFHYHSQFR